MSSCEEPRTAETQGWLSWQQRSKMRLWGQVGPHDTKLCIMGKNLDFSLKDNEFKILSKDVECNLHLMRYADYAQVQ